MEQFLCVDILCETIDFYLCHAQKVVKGTILSLYTCKSLQLDLEIDAGVGLMAFYLAPGE